MKCWTKAGKMMFYAGLFCCMLFAKSAQAQGLTGRYACIEAKVQGKTAPCTGTLILMEGGQFQLHGWQGNYVVTGRWMELSDTVVRSRAKIEPGHKIVFRYRTKRGWCEMTYERRFAELGKRYLS